MNPIIERLQKEETVYNMITDKVKEQYITKNIIEMKESIEFFEGKNTDNKELKVFVRQINRDRNLFVLNMMRHEKIEVDTGINNYYPDDPAQGRCINNIKLLIKKIFNYIDNYNINLYNNDDNDTIELLNDVIPALFIVLPNNGWAYRNNMWEIYSDEDKERIIELYRILEISITI